MYPLIQKKILWLVTTWEPGILIVIGDVGRSWIRRCNIYINSLTDAKVSHQFLRYVESQWVSSTTFPPKSWSQYGLEIRTNNDVEGWHRGFNSGQPRPAFYTFMTKVYNSLEDTRMLMQTGQHRRRNDAAVTQKNAALRAILAQLENMPEGRGISHVLDDIAQLFDYESGAAI